MENKIKAFHSKQIKILKEDKFYELIFIDNKIKNRNYISSGHSP